MDEHVKDRLTNHLTGAPSTGAPFLQVDPMNPKHITQHLQFIARAYPRDIITELRPYIEQFIDLGAKSEHWTDDVYERVLTRQRTRVAFGTLMLWADIALWQLKQQHNQSDLAQQLTRYMDDHLKRRAQTSWQVMDIDAQSDFATYFGQTGSQHVGSSHRWIKGIDLEMDPKKDTVPLPLQTLKQRLGHKINSWFEHTIMYAPAHDWSHDMWSLLHDATTPTHWLKLLAPAHIKHLCLQEVTIGHAPDDMFYVFQLLQHLNTRHITTLELLMCVPYLRCDHFPQLAIDRYHRTWLWQGRTELPDDIRHERERYLIAIDQSKLDHLICNPEHFAKYLPLERIEHIILDSPLLWAYPEVQQGFMESYTFNHTKHLTIKADKSMQAFNTTPHLIANLAHLKQLQGIQLEGGFKLSLMQEMVKHARTLNPLLQIQTL